MTTDCIFCKIIDGKIPANKMYEDESILAFWDISPQAPKHFLVIPKKHISGPCSLTTVDDSLMGELLRKAAGLAAENGLDSYRFVVNNGAQAGQTVFHLHLHVLGGRNLGWPPG